MPAARNTSQDKITGARLRARRISLHITKQSLGKAVGATTSQIDAYENGERRIDSGRLRQIAQVLKVPLSFFGREQEDRVGSGEAYALLDSAFGLRLVKAFARIADRRVQLSTIELVEGIAAATEQTH